MSNVKNYTEQGGEKTVIEGVLEVKNGGKLIIDGQEFSSSGTSSHTTPSSSPTGFRKVSYQATSTSTNVEGIRHDFNDLIDAMKEAGLMETERPHITISSQPQDAEVTEGQINARLTVQASGSDGRALTYKWFSNTQKSTNNGTFLLTNNTGEFIVPTTLTEGTYYYYCVISAEDVDDVTTNIVTITVKTS